MTNHRDSDWYKAIKDMPVGTKLRMNHEGCSTSESLMVSKTDKGCSAWCFKCATSGMFVPAPAPSLEEVLARNNLQKASDKEMRLSKGLPLPKQENVSEWPTEARMWLYKAGLNNADIERCNIYYHPRSGRVVIPVMDGMDLVYWQARGFSDSGPKYLNPSVVDRSRLVANWYGKNDLLVLTEDWLSGYRVHRATGYNVYALLGTHLTDSITAQIVYQGTPVAVWLDGDGPGQKAAHKIIQKLQSYCINVVNINTELDPKLYSDREIREEINVAGYKLLKKHSI